MWPGMWVTSLTGGVGWDLRKFSRILASEVDGWISGLAEALWRVHTWWLGGRWKSCHKKIVSLSPYVEKTFNSKVIKSFVPELRSRKCFFVFRDSYVIYVRYGHYERFAYRYEYVYFMDSYLTMLQRNKNYFWTKMNLYKIITISEPLFW